MDPGMADLIDLRAKVTPVANQVLEAHSKAFDIDKSEVVRKIISEWAEKQLHVSTLVLRLTRGEGSKTD